MQCLYNLTSLFTLALLALPYWTGVGGEIPQAAKTYSAL
jgi:hypothetical protein